MSWWKMQSTTSVIALAVVIGNLLFQALPLSIPAIGSLSLTQRLEGDGNLTVPFHPKNTTKAENLSA